MWAPFCDVYSPNAENTRGINMDKAFNHSEICKELNNIYQAKNKDYGDSFGRTMKEYGLVMPAIRMEDKLTRYKQLIKRLDGPCVISESIEDTLLDLANYAIMTVIELRGEKDAVCSRKE